MARKTPKATLAVLFITGIATLLQFCLPVLIVALERAPGMLASGQWWRLAGIAIIGFLVERVFGSARWVILYLTGAVVGELAGGVWKPVGAGSSVAICGLLGALAAWLLSRREPVQSRVGGTIILLGALVLTGMRDLHGPPLVAGALAAAVILWRDAPQAEGVSSCN